MNVLKVLKKHYSPEQLGWGSWKEWKQPEDFIYSEECLILRQNYDSAIEKWRAHPYQGRLVAYHYTTLQV